MPAAGMRRTTRVFVPKTTKDGGGVGGEGVRVLRSGRRLWVESSGDEGGLKGGGGGDDTWLGVIGQGKGGNGRRRLHDEHGAEEIVMMLVDGEEEEEEAAAPDLVMREAPDSSALTGDVDRFFGKVYSRRRRRWKRKSFDGECSKGYDGGEGREDDLYYRLHYVRQRKRRLVERSSVGNFVQDCPQNHRRDYNWVLYAFVEAFGARSGRFDRLLISILRRMTNAVVEFEGLSAFLTSEPISFVFASHGICFSRNWRCLKSSGLCSIYGAVDFVPLFEVHFSAAPRSFVYLHTRMLLRSVCMSSALVLRVENLLRGDRGDADDIDDDLQCASSHRDNVEIVLSDPGNGEKGITRVDQEKGNLQDTDMDMSFGDHEKQYLGYRIGNSTRIGHKRRRRSLRTRRARNPLLLALDKANSSLLPKHLALEKITSPGAYAANNGKLKKAGRKTSASDIKFVKSTSISLVEDIDSVTCSGNILVTETDRCYRVEGASITLEMNDSNEWVLAAKKDGLTKKFSIKAPTEIKLSSINRFSHSVMWIADGGWRLEFADRQKWAIFKELARVCAERNSVPPSPVVKSIPVPGVQEVSLVPAADAVGFVMPASYIKLTESELSRALLRRSANYDMDSDDELWLNEFNNGFVSGHEPSEPLTEEIFELMVDAFEKASYCSPENFGNLAVAVDLCADLASKDMAEAVHDYWLKKRAEKQGPLLRVFQMNQPRRPQEVDTEAVSRKRRSSKRQASRVPLGGKGKTRLVLEAMAAEQHAQEEQAAMLRAQESRAAAKRAMRIAMIKRQRAQFLMENADLAMYRAAIMVRIADAAQAAESTQVAAHFLD